LATSSRALRARGAGLSGLLVRPPVPDSGPKTRTRCAPGAVSCSLHGRAAAEPQFSTDGSRTIAIAEVCRRPFDGIPSHASRIAFAQPHSAWRTRGAARPGGYFSVGTHGGAQHCHATSTCGARSIGSYERAAFESERRSPCVAWHGLLPGPFSDPACAEWRRTGNHGMRVIDSISNWLSKSMIAAPLSGLPSCAIVPRDDSPPMRSRRDAHRSDEFDPTARSHGASYYPRCLRSAQRARVVRRNSND